MKKREEKYLNRVQNVTELRALSTQQLVEYCRELREFIIHSVAQNPGHLGSSLGAVELAVALHYTYDTPSDKLIWDVGHQAYAHKIITERKLIFHKNRQKDGISGFPKRSESIFDCFGGGHASVSISAAVGMAQANKIKGHSDKKVVAIIGDGALTGGLAFEGLINAGEGDLLVVLNDNNISIDKGVGRLSHYLTTLSTSRSYNNLKQGLWRVFGVWPWLLRQIKKVGNGAKSFFLKNSNLFEALGFRYFGPVDGHDVRGLVRRLRAMRKIDGPKLLHIITTKGKGYTPAENDQTCWHAPGKFDPITAVQETPQSGLKYQDVFGHTMLQLAHKNPKIVAITPAMPSGSGLNIMMQEMPERTFDVGIAEGHSVTFAAGLACEGLLPICSIYSSFAQRALDNIIHDVVLQNLRVILCIDRAGLVGEDGATHHGLYDMSMLLPLPNTRIIAPSSPTQLRNILYTETLENNSGCTAIRYPRGGNFDAKIINTPMLKVETGKSEIIRQGQSKTAIIAIGDTLQIAQTAAETLDATLIDLIYAKPLDTLTLDKIANSHNQIITIENGTQTAGVGSTIQNYISLNHPQTTTKIIGIPDTIIEQATTTQQWESAGLTPQNIIKTAQTQ